MVLRYFSLVLVLLVSGCAIVPDEIKVDDNTPLVTYTKAVTGGDSALGKPARWGGIIVGVENKPQKTYIEVVHFPLNHYGKPITSEDTVGRFKVVINGFVDPILFEEGRSVTFVGTVMQPMAGMVGEQPYMYPTLEAKDYHLWRKETVYDVSGFYFDYRLGWYSPFYYPYYRPGWGFHTSRIRVTQSNSPTPRPVRADRAPSSNNITTRPVNQQTRIKSTEK